MSLRTEFIRPSFKKSPLEEIKKRYFFFSGLLFNFQPTVVCSIDEIDVEYLFDIVE